MITTSNTQDPEWGNENALRAYPLRDDAPAAEKIPAWLISDLHVTVSSAYGTVFVSSVYISDNIVSVGISGVRTGLAPEGLLTKTVTRDELEPFRSYSMDRMSGSASGCVAFGEPPADVVPMKFTFGPEEAPITPSAIVRTGAPGVSSIADDDHGVEASGIIDLSGNSEFRTYKGPDGEIVVALSDIYRDLSTSVCSSTPSFNRCGATPVKTINGVAPDATGKITLRFR